MEKQDTQAKIDLNFHVEDTGGRVTGPNNDNENTNSLDTAFASGELEVDGHLGSLLPSCWVNVTILTREVNSL